MRKYRLYTPFIIWQKKGEIDTETPTHQIIEYIYDVSMKRHAPYILLLILAFAMISHFSYAQQYEWIKTGGSTIATSTGYTNDGSYFTTTDPNGNVYSVNVVGNTGITADTFYRSAAYGAFNSVLLTSYDCLGNMRWAKLIGTYTGPIILGLTADSIGHVYLCGVFPHGVLHIGYDTTIPSSTSNQVAGLIQFDTSGHLNWIRWVGPNTTSNLNATILAMGALALDGQQNAHFIKMYRSGAQLTPTVTSVSGNYDLKYDASGVLLSATQMQLDTTWKILGTAIDFHTDKLYAYGYSSGFTASASSNFVAAFDANRNRIWMDSMVDITYPGAGGFCGITYDNSGHLYLAATGTGVLAYRGYTAVNSLASLGATSFVVKTDTFGNPLWLRGYSGSSGVNWFNAIALASNDKIAIAGVMTGVVTSDGNTILSFSGEGQNSFFSILDTSGHVQSIEQIHGGGFYDAANTISSDRVGNLFIGGWFASNIWGGTLSPATSVGGNSDFFVGKFGVSCGCTGMPSASFTYTGSPTVTFTYTGTTAGIDSLRWYFGDGGTSTAYNPGHAYTAAGTYTVRVNIYSACGGDSYFADIFIPCVAAPVTSFTSSGISATRNFTYTGTPSLPDSVTWNFGDGGHGVGLTAAHTYALAGTYNVCATTYTPCGNTTACNTINITCVGPLSAAYSHTGYAPVSFTYTGTTSGLDSVVWHYGDGGHGTGLISSHAYAAVGVHTACVLVYNHCGVDSFCSTFSLPCVAPPTASYTFTGTGASRSFTYTGTTVALDSVVWNFGDGGHAVGLTTSHTYMSTGVFTACVTAYSACGSNIFCSFVTIGCVTIPTVAFTTTGSPNVTFSYTGSTGALDSVVWNFGDGNSGTGVTTSHLYAVMGTYTVCVTAYTQCGYDSICSNVIVSCPAPVAAFTHTGSPAVTFTYTGTTPAIDSIVWDFGDGNSDTGMSPSHGYATTNTYHVCVIIYTPCGSDTICADVNAIGVGINDPANTLTHITIYPTPTTDLLNISGITSTTRYRLFSLTGTTLQDGTLQTGNNTLNVSNLPSGVYLLQFSNDNEARTTARVIKQ